MKVAETQTNRMGLVCVEKQRLFSQSKLVHTTLYLHHKLAEIILQTECFRPPLQPCLSVFFSNMTSELDKQWELMFFWVDIG